MYVAILNSYILTFSSVFNFMQTSLNGFSSFLFIMVSGLTQMIPVHTRKEHMNSCLGYGQKPQPKELVMGSLCRCSSTKCNWNVLKKIHAHVYVWGYFLIWLIVHQWLAREFQIWLNNNIQFFIQCRLQKTCLTQNDIKF